MAQRSKVGHYDIVAELGRGGMGVVYKGYESSLHRHVAIKMLSEALADDASVVERFFREARSMAQLNDPHIVQIYLVGEDHGQPFFAMEFVEGESLSQRLKRERQLDPIEASRILLQVAQGLAAAHDRGVIHRDIKPANLLITQRGVIKVADFGIALATQDFNKKLTGTGQFVGTPGYLSPEVCLGKQVDQRSDIFALGIVYFEMMTGQSPYKDESPLGMMLEVVQAGIPDVREVNAAIDPRLSEILQRMVAKDPVHRYADCHQLVGDLVAAGINAAGPVTPPRPIPGAIMGTVVNTPTPAELKRLSPVPVAAVGYQTDPAAAARLSAPQPLMPAERVAPAPVARKSSPLPWAIAAVLLLGAGGAGAWYSGLFKTTSTAPTTLASAPSPTAPPTIASVSPPSPPTAVNGPATPAPGSMPVPVPAPVTDAATVQSAAILGGDTTNNQPSVTLNPDSQPEPESPSAMGDAPAGAAGNRGSAQGDAPVYAEQAPEPEANSARAAAPQLTQSPRSAAIGQRLANLRDQRLGRGAENESRAPAPQLARANNPRVQPEPPAHAGTPRVIVLSIGDEAVAGPAEIAIEESLGESGLDVVDEDLIGAMARFERSGDPAVLPLVTAAKRHAEYVVVVRSVPLGEQALNFHGQSMTQYTARLQVAAYDVRRARKLGSGWNAQVSFTHLNADPNTREALAPLMGKIAQNLGARSRG